MSVCYACANGVAAATLAAGPAVAIPPLLVGALVTKPAVSIEFLPVAMVIIIVGTVVGAFVAMIPCCLGASVLGWLGCRHQIARSPSVWAVAGAVLGSTIGAVAFIREGGVAGPLLFAGAGTACALICRRGTRWFD